MKPKNILITSFGHSWQIIPELFGFFNHDSLPLYTNHPDIDKINKQHVSHQLKYIDEIHVIHTDSPVSQEAINTVNIWRGQLNIAPPVIRYFSYKGVSDLFNPTECRQMTDLIFRTIMHAHNEANGGDVFLSLTGGRKNMSADIQWASELWGCKAMVHIADNIFGQPFLDKNDTSSFTRALPGEFAKLLFPMVVFGKKQPHSVILLDKHFNKKAFPLKANACNKADTSLLEAVEKGLKRSRNLLFNHYQVRNKQSRQMSFTGLQLLGPGIIQDLETQFIGRDLKSYKNDLNWVRGLPKAELHCHLGGVLTTEALIDVAMVLHKEVKNLRNQIPAFDDFLNGVENHVRKADAEALRKMIKKSKSSIRKAAMVAEPFGVAGFIQTFAENAQLLDSLIFGETHNAFQWIGKGIDHYEVCGDLQGSGILKNQKTLAKTCEYLVKHCMSENIRYLELRCSPGNYATSGFSIEAVIKTIQNTLQASNFTRFRLIIIASRHRGEEMAKKHIDYVLKNIEDQTFASFFAGFDVAGNEKAKTPYELKENLGSLLRQSIRMTIHAGEGVPVNNVWEAVYELNADRIGHGLTLKDNQRLLDKFVDRRIAVEMCPSSNYQIVGFRDYFYDGSKDYPIYPLMDYFKKGVRVTINTDNPGISRTGLSHEYLKAACMTQGGISKWDMLQIVRNGFISAFIPFEEKRELLLAVENELMNML